MSTVSRDICLRCPTTSHRGPGLSLHEPPGPTPGWATHPPALGVARYADDVTDPAGVPDDPVIVLIEDEEPTMSVEEWLALLDGDPPSDVDADAAEILREFREH